MVVRIEIGVIAKGRQPNELVSFDFIYAGMLPFEELLFEVPFLTSARGSGEMHMLFELTNLKKNR